MEEAIYSGLIACAVLMVLALVAFMCRFFILLRSVISESRERAIQTRAREKASQSKVHYLSTNGDIGCVSGITSAGESPTIAEEAALLMLAQANSKVRIRTSKSDARTQNPPNSPLSTLPVSPHRLPQQAAEEDVVVVQLDLSGPSTPDHDDSNVSEEIQPAMALTAATSPGRATLLTTEA